MTAYLGLEPKKKPMKKNYIIHDPAHCNDKTRHLMLDAVRWFLNRYNMQLNDFDGEFEEIINL